VSTSAGGAGAGAALVQPDPAVHGADGDAFTWGEAETMTTLYTIGYGNRQPEEFFSMIPEGVIVIDVRRSTGAWCQAYIESRLRERLGARYQWWRALGEYERKA